MTRRRLWVGLVGIIVVFVVGFLLVSPAIAPTPSGIDATACLTRDAADDCIRFPTVTGANLNGVELTLPDAFGGTLNFVVVPWDDAQQVQAETWLPFARELADMDSDVVFYNVAILPELSPAIRIAVSAGMRLLITDDALRDVTVLVYLEDVDAFLTALDVPDRDTIVVFLLNENAEVIWRGRDVYDEEQADSARDIVLGVGEAVD